MKSDVRQIGKYIAMLYRAELIHTNAAMKDLGVSSSEFMFLLNIPMDEGVNLAYLSHALYVDPAHTSKVIQGLVDKGFVKKVKDPYDKRSCNVFLTEEGKKRVPMIRKILSDWVACVTSSLTDGEREMVLDCLRRMVSKIPSK